MEKLDLSHLTPEQKNHNSAIWAILHLLSEISLSFKLLRDRLLEKGTINIEDEEFINIAFAENEELKKAYIYMQSAFNEKFFTLRASLDETKTVSASVKGENEIGVDKIGPASQIRREDIEELKFYNTGEYNNGN